MKSSHKIRVTLEIPHDLATDKGLKAMLTAALIRFRIVVVSVNREDIKKCTELVVQ